MGVLDVAADFVSFLFDPPNANPISVRRLRKLRRITVPQSLRSLYPSTYSSGAQLARQNVPQLGHIIRHFLFDDLGVLLCGLMFR